MLGSQLHASWTRSSSLLLFRVSISCAQGKLSYCTAVVLPLGETPRQLEGAGRGWRPRHSWPWDCWLQDSPGLSQISAAMDQPLRIHPVPAPGPDSACPSPGTAHQAWGLLAPLLCSAQTVTPVPCPALRLHEPPQTAAAPCSQLRLLDWCSLLRPLPVHAELPQVL